MGEETEADGVAVDGQHRTGYETATVNVSREGIRLIYEHIRTSACMPMPLLPDSPIPLAFLVDKDKPDELIVQCGICKKELGTCKGGVAE